MTATNHRRFRGVTLRVSDPGRLARFYRDELGMRVANGPEGLDLQYPTGGGCLRLLRARTATRYRPERLDEYWKIGITLPDVDLAHAQLRRRGIDVSEPHRFEDIGYLCHLVDPEGFSVELLQHTFDGAPRTADGDPRQPLGGGARLAHVTLRTSDIDASLIRYREGLGMALLSVQPVTSYGFTLYFLAHADERPPDPHLESVTNRPWLWQRPYPLLELQHLHRPDAFVRQPLAGEPGFERLLFVPPAEPISRGR